MATLFIFIFLIIALCFSLLRCTKTCASILVVIFISYILIGNGFVPYLLLKYLQTPFINLTEPIWKKENAIVLLGAGAITLPTTNKINPMIMAYSRIYETAYLYFSCAKSHNVCTIIISGGDAMHSGEPEAIVYRKALLQLGVSQSHIKLESNSMNTYKNAELTSRIINQHAFEQVILVTSGIHLKRALLYFSHFGIHAKPALADYLSARFSFIPLSYNFVMTDFAIHEYMGIIRFYIYQWMGWNLRIRI